MLVGAGGSWWVLVGGWPFGSLAAPPDAPPHPDPDLDPGTGTSRDTARHSRLLADRYETNGSSRCQGRAGQGSKEKGRKG